MGKTLAKPNTRATELLRELESLPPDHKLTAAEFLTFVRKMPKTSGGASAAEIIRELRGPLPDDDAEYQRDRRG